MAASNQQLTSNLIDRFNECGAKIEEIKEYINVLSMEIKKARREFDRRFSDDEDNLIKEIFRTEISVKIDKKDVMQELLSAIEKIIVCETYELDVLGKIRELTEQGVSNIFFNAVAVREQQIMNEYDRFLKIRRITEQDISNMLVSAATVVFKQRQLNNQDKTQIGFTHNPIRTIDGLISNFHRASTLGSLKLTTSRASSLFMELKTIFPKVMDMAAYARPVDLDVAIIGGINAGKTALILRYINNKFCDYNNSSSNCVEPEVYYKDFDQDIQKNLDISLRLWDIPSNKFTGGYAKVLDDKLECILRSWNVRIELIVVNLQCRDTLVWAQKYLDRKNKDSDAKPPLSRMLVASSDDVEENHKTISEDDLQAFSERNGNIPYIRVSASEGTNVDAAFHLLVTDAIEKRLMQAEIKKNMMALNQLSRAGFFMPPEIAENIAARTVNTGQPFEKIKMAREVVWDDVPREMPRRYHK